MATWYLGRTETPITTKSRANTFDVSLEGWPYRGTLVCLSCPMAEVIPIECNYRCIQKSNGGRYAKRVPCPERYRCKCGWDQTAMLRALELIP